jgi:hypothetical protein
MHVRARGYVGFGLSPNGRMFPSDVAMGWVKDGKVHFAVSIANITEILLKVALNTITITS